MPVTVTAVSEVEREGQRGAPSVHRVVRQGEEVVLDVVGAVVGACRRRNRRNLDPGHRRSIVGGDGDRNRADVIGTGAAVGVARPDPLRRKYSAPKPHVDGLGGFRHVVVDDR